MLYIFYGEDEFSRREAVLELQARLGPPEGAALNTARFGVEETSPGEVMAMADAVPFLAEGRLVVVEGALAQADGGARRGRSGGRREAGAQGWEALAEYAPRMPETTSLVLADGPLNANNLLLLALTPVARVKRFGPLRGRDLADWVRRRAAAEGGRIEAEAVRALAEALGSDLRAISNELRKLLLYVGERPITAADVRALTSYAQEENIFSLVDDVIEGRYPKARLRLQHLLDEGQNASQIIAMLGRQVRMLIAARDLTARRASQRELEEGLGTWSEFAIKKAISQSKRFSPEELVRMHRRLLEADLSIKTGRLTEVVALDLLLAEMGGVKNLRL